MSRAKPLWDLQEIDIQRDGSVARLKQVVAALRGNPALAAAQAAVEQAEQLLADVERRSRLHESERQDTKAHIAREEQKLYGGRVKNPKELESLQMEIESLKRRLENLDDTALELMIERDDAADELARATARLQETAADTAEETAALGEEKAVLTSRIRELDARRAEAAARIDAADLSVYDRVRPRKGGTPVALLKGENCAACGMQLPRTDLAEAKAGERLVFCPACNRILLG